jgi:hypothetical protein
LLQDFLNRKMGFVCNLLLRHAEQRPTRDSVATPDIGCAEKSAVARVGSGAVAGAQAQSASTLANNTGGAFFGTGFASGTDNAPGGLALIGENGPEILNIPKGLQVIPNDVLKSGCVRGVSAPVSIQIDARNADAAGLANLQVQLTP